MFLSLWINFIDAISLVFIVVVPFVASFLVTHSKNYCSRSVLRSLAPLFSSSSIQVKDLCLSLIHLSWLLYIMRDNGLISLFLHRISSFLNTNYWRNALHCVLLITLLKISWPYICRFISRFSKLFHWRKYLFLCQYYILLINNIDL